MPRASIDTAAGPGETSRMSIAPTQLAKPAWYYAHARTQIAPLLPSRLDRVLDVGCGQGATLEWLRAEKGARWVAGVEYMPEEAAVAQTRLDACWTGDVESMALDIAPASLDLVLCLDVLEHLRDPWGLVRRLATLLRPGGAFITSIPNARHMNLVRQLVLRGRFDYAPEGTMDSTHLRWFTRRTAIELVEQGGLKVDRWIAPARDDARVRLKNALTLGLLREFFDFQYIIRGIKPAA